MADSSALLETLKGLKPLLDIGVTGSVAIISVWFAIKKDADIRRIEKEKLAIEREKLGLVQATEKDLREIQRVMYDRMIAISEKQTARLAAMSTEQTRTIAALTEAIQVEEELEAGATSDIAPTPEPRAPSKPGRR